MITFESDLGAGHGVAIYVMGADGARLRELFDSPNEQCCPSWQPVLAEPSPAPPAPGGRANGPIYFRVGGGDGPSWIESILPDGSGRHVVFDQDSPVHYDRIAFSPDGRRIAFDNYLVGDYGIETANPDGSGVVRLTDGVNDSWASWSPDGTKILFSSTRYDPNVNQCEPGADFTCPSDIYVMNADGSNVVRLASDPGPEYAPGWSPDGSRIAFVKLANDVGYTAIFTMKPDGTDVRQVSSADRGSDFAPSWSPDGTQLVFASIREEDWGIWIVNADGSDEHLTLGGTGAGYVDDPVWSPDGTLIAFMGNLTVDDYSPDNALYVMRPDGTGVTPLADAPTYGVAGDIAWQPLVAGSPPVEPSPVPSEPASVEVRVTTTHGIAEFPDAVAAGEGGVWVSGPRNDGSGAGDVVRLDPNTGDIVARIPVQALPGWEFGGAGMTVADGSVWVVGSIGAGPTCCTAFVTRIDPSTDAVIDEIEVPGQVLFGADVWVDGSSVYVLSFVEGGTSLELAKVDVATHAIEWRVPVPGQWSQTVFFAGGSVWVLGTHPDAHGPIEVDMLYRLDPATGALLGQIAFRTSIYIPVLQADTIWFRTEDGAQRFDATSAEFIGEPVQPAPGCCTGAFVSDGADGVWVMSSPGAGVERSIWHIDASGRVVASGTIEDRQAFQDMQGQSHAFDPVTQTIWVQHYEDSVSRVEILPVASAG